VHHGPRHGEKEYVNVIDLTGKTALVTGGGKGIGRGITLVLAQQGANVAVGDIDTDSAEKTVGEIQAIGREGIAVQLDVTSQTSADEAVSMILERWGHLDILVNNAGIGRLAGHAGVGPDDDWEKNWDAVLDINVKGVMHCTKAVVGHFMEREYGKIINIASGAGRGPIGWGPPTGSSGVGSPYGPSKAAVINYTRYVAAGLGRSNINVNAICPGRVWTAFHELAISERQRTDPVLARKDLNEIFAQTAGDQIPLGREQAPEEIGKLTAFLASEDACSITGQSIHVDGGERMA